MYKAIPNNAYSSFDFYPFGMIMPGRAYSGGSGYRFGFNGKEKDDEVEGGGNSIDLGARLYSPRLGKLFSSDSKEIEYPWQSTYAYFGNSPIHQLDIDGEGGPGGVPAMANGHGGYTMAQDNMYNGKPVYMHEIAPKQHPTNQNQVKQQTAVKSSSTHKGVAVMATTYNNQNTVPSSKGDMTHLPSGLPDTKAAPTWKQIGNKLSNSGTALTIVGAALTLTVIGAEVGVPLMLAGEYTGYAGTAITATDDFSKGHYTKAFADVSFTLLLRKGNDVANKAVGDVSDQLTKDIFKAPVNTAGELGGMIKDKVEEKVTKKAHN